MSDENTPQTVPLERLQKTVLARKEAEARAEAAEARLAEFEKSAGKAEQLAADLAAERAGRADDLARFGAEKAFLSVGVDDVDVMDVLRSRWSKLEEKGRPELRDWLDTGAREDKIAASLLPPLPSAADTAAAAAAPATAPEPPATTTARATTTNAGAAPPPPAASPMSREVYEKRLSRAKSSADVKAVMSQYFGD
jgi:hypothetical protein